MGNSTSPRLARLSLGHHGVGHRPLRGDEGIALMARTFTGTPTQIFRKREEIG
jgi:hypothetical protein